MSRIVVTRDFDLPRAIVWEAFVDPALVEGWLADATIEPDVGSPVALRWRDPHHGVPFAGTVTELAAERRIVLVDGLDRFEVSLAGIEGGTRGTSTRVTLDVDVRAGAPDDDAESHWRTHLEALEDLLRGHPVVWSRWDLDYGPVTAAFRSGTTSGAAF